MERREVLRRIAGLWLLSASKAFAQRAKVPVIGLLDGGERTAWWVAFKQQMRQLGYVEGRNIAYEARYARENFDRLPVFAQELVRLDVAVIVTAATVATQAALRATSRIPIVTGSGSDHVAMGFVGSLARPGGNVTGVSSNSSELTAKRFELLHQAIPKLARLAVLWQMDSSGSTTTIRDLESAARASKVTMQNIGVRRPDELAGAFATATRERAEAVFVVGGPLTVDKADQIVQLALKHKLATMFGNFEQVEVGGLMSYGPSFTDLFRRAAVYVDKILKGAKPGDLPIEQPTKFETVINARTAKALGIQIPQSLLVRADRVID